MGPYSVWFSRETEKDFDPSQNLPKDTRCFISDLPTYAIAARVVANLEDEFDVHAWIEKD